MKIKTKLLMVLITLFAAAAFSAEPVFSWKLSAFTVSDGMQTVLDVSRPVNLTNGDAFGIVIETDGRIENAYCYAIYEDENGIASALYDGKIPSSGKVTLPSEEETFSVTPPSGIEKIHIIVCSVEQKKLEQFIEKIDGSKDKKTASEKVVDEISRLKLGASSFAEKPVKPATTGGTTRSLGKLSVSPYTEYSGSAVYVKTIRITH